MTLVHLIDYFIPVPDESVSKKYAAMLAKYRARAITEDVSATTAPVCYTVKAGYTLMGHAIKAGPCHDNFRYLKAWNFLDEQEIKPIIKPDKNALDDTNCASRNREVKLRNKLGYKKWTKRRGYGHRWPATEGINSAIKRIFGEQLLATSETGLLQEAASKVWAYQRLKRSGEA